jgi:hypothetical protein
MRVSGRAYKKRQNDRELMKKAYRNCRGKTGVQKEYYEPSRHHYPAPRIPSPAATHDSLDTIAGRENKSSHSKLPKKTWSKPPQKTCYKPKFPRTSLWKNQVWTRF